MSDVVAASGGLVFRPAAGGFEILVVHRPRYDDWSLPKGKDDPDETPVEAAVREVEEETGFRCRVVAPLAEVSYETPLGVSKLVRYFAMRPLGFTGFEPNDEVDDVRWAAAPEAADLLSYDRDRELLAGADLAGFSTTGTLYLVRHAVAGSRSRWQGDDRDRPLTERGERQAEAIAAWLAPLEPDRILSSPYLRCVDTVRPLAARLGREVEQSHALAEGADTGFALGLVSDLAGSVAVLSSHGDVIPDVLDHLARRGMEINTPVEAKKGSTWVVDVEAAVPVRARYVPPPDV